MGFFDKAKTFLGGSSMVTLEFLEIERQAPAGATFPVGDSVVKGRYRVTAQKDCTVLKHVAQIRSRWPEKDGTLGTTIAEDVHDADNQVYGLPYQWPYNLKAGQSVEDGFCIVQVDLVQQLQRYGLSGLDPRVEFFIKVIVDVQGSPFDPEFESRLAVV